MNARTVYQCLRDAALGIHALSIEARLAHGVVNVAIDDWHLTLTLDSEGLAQCVHCTAPNGEQAGVEDWQRYGTNPTDLLSLWERTQLERLLAP
ncbi:hypothetical protein [Pseudomonas sp. Leaf58]|uniref:DUF7693 family protein n=1 Tax=Pseudomonas TaxID=286 RepID=UPI000ACD84BB|nr:hypothetical protein [Pseudomonas sp. Leaf58]